MRTAKKTYRYLHFVIQHSARILRFSDKKEVYRNIICNRYANKHNHPHINVAELCKVCEHKICALTHVLHAVTRGGAKESGPEVTFETESYACGA